MDSSEMGRKGGKRRSEAKAVAAINNGQLGGRPQSLATVNKARAEMGLPPLSAAGYARAMRRRPARCFLCEATKVQTYPDEREYCREHASTA